MADSTLERPVSVEPVQSPNHPVKVVTELVLHVSRARADLVRSSATVERVAVYWNDGSFDDHRIHAWVDLLEGIRIEVDGPVSDIVGVAVAWGSPVVLVGEGARGGFRLEAKPRKTRLRLREGAGKRPLSPWGLVHGQILGGGPQLVVASEQVEEEVRIAAPEWGSEAYSRPRILERVVLD